LSVFRVFLPFAFLFFFGLLPISGLSLSLYLSRVSLSLFLSRVSRVCGFVLQFLFFLSRCLLLLLLLPLLDGRCFVLLCCFLIQEFSVLRNPIEREKRKERKREVSNGGNRDAPQTSMNVLIEDTVIVALF
jgi:hypothetical protein